MIDRRKLFWIAPLAVAGLALFVMLGGWIVESLWNWLLPPLFGWKTLGFWQAVGLLALCRILFGGLGPMGGGPRSRMRRHMDERWQRMTPEERERFRQGLREGAGPGPATT